VLVTHKRFPSGYRWLMFTGIVRELGKVEAIEPTDQGLLLRVLAPETSRGVAEGDSVSVSGVCLTAVAVEDGAIGFDVVQETLRRSTLGRLEAGARVNIEPALQAGDPVGGHFVQGHVDGVGRVRQVSAEGLEIEAGPEIMRYCVEKGSIAVEGVSLTIAGVEQTAFTVALVPHTREVTTLGRVGERDELNLEVDMLAKYVEKLT
jgi:riboflavin synthase